MKHAKRNESKIMARELMYGVGMMNMTLLIQMIMKRILTVTNKFVNKLSGNGSLRGKMDLRKNLRKRILDILGLHRRRNTKRKSGDLRRMMRVSLFRNRLLLLSWMNLGMMHIYEE